AAASSSRAVRPDGNGEGCATENRLLNVASMSGRVYRLPCKSAGDAAIWGESGRHSGEFWQEFPANRSRPRARRRLHDLGIGLGTGDSIRADADRHERGLAARERAES